MTLSSKVRTLAFAGSIAVSGCAASMTTQLPRAGRLSPQPERTVETPQQRCQRQSTRVQECIIEGIVTQCRASRTGDPAAAQACVDEGLRQSSAMVETRALSITVSAGQEVFSMRLGNSSIMEVIKLNATAIDSTGVSFSFDIDRFSPMGGDKNTVTHEELRLNFDGNRSGNWTRVDITEVRVLAAESVSGGQARLSLETEDPRVLVRPSGPLPSK